MEKRIEEMDLEEATRQLEALGSFRNMTEEERALSKALLERIFKLSGLFEGGEE